MALHRWLIPRGLEPPVTASLDRMPEVTQCQQILQSTSQIWVAKLLESFVKEPRVCQEHSDEVRNVLEKAAGTQPIADQLLLLQNPRNH